MTKAEMMAGFDQVVTDPRLARGRVEAHLAAAQHEPRLLSGEYVCLATGGSSGLRGVFVQTVGEFTAFVASLVRQPLARLRAAHGGTTGGAADGLVIGLVAAVAPRRDAGRRPVVSLRWPAGAGCSSPGTPARPGPAQTPSPRSRRRTGPG
jgi:hypothetical protein